MQTSLVLTVIADDRPGIVEALAEPILAAEANWEESRMSRLAGKFVGLLRVSVENSRAEALAASLAALNARGLTVVVAHTGAGDDSALRPLHLELVGNDRPGIIRDIARVLAAQHVNIDELETDITSAPMSGEPLFRARAELRVPATVTPDALRQRLEALAGELMVDLALDEGAESAGD